MDLVQRNVIREKAVRDNLPSQNGARNNSKHSKFRDVEAEGNEIAHPLSGEDPGTDGL